MRFHVSHDVLSRYDFPEMHVGLLSRVHQRIVLSWLASYGCALKTTKGNYSWFRLRVLGLHVICHSVFNSLNYNVKERSVFRTTICWAGVL